MFYFLITDQRKTSYTLEKLTYYNSMPSAPSVTFPVTEGNEIRHIYFQFTIPARKLTHNMKFECFWMQKDTDFGNTIIIHHFGLENRQNPTQKDTNFGNTIIIHHFG